jgi:hypothetical protein
MIAFFGDAPRGAIALIVAGAVLLLLEAPIRLRWETRVARMSDGPIRADSRSFLPLVLKPIASVLLIAGFAWSAGIFAFLGDAPPGAIALIVAGAVLLALEVPMRLRWKARASRMSDGPVREGSRPFLPLAITPAAWVLLIAGLAWYVLA